MAAQTLLTAATAFQSYEELPSLQVACYLLAQIAGAPYNTMTAQTLLTAATAFQSYDELPSLQVACYLLAQIAGAPYNTMTAQQLLTASGPFQILQDKTTALQVIAYELSQIA